MKLTIRFDVRGRKGETDGGIEGGEREPVTREEQIALVMIKMLQTAEGRQILETTVDLHLPLSHWMAVHGYLQLARSRLPSTGPSSDVVDELIRRIDAMLVERGVLPAPDV